MSTLDAREAPDRQVDVRFMGVVVRVPDHVVRRSFPAETIVLDLKAGIYHGLDHTAGHILETLAEVGRVRVAADRLAEEYDQSPSRIQRDLCRVCEDLLERGLIELAEPLG